MDNSRDVFFLSQALDLAKIRRGFCAPNPSVGAVIVQEGEIVATGYHMAAGQPHAEIDALQKLKQSLPESTVYSSLEPCCHWGKTPPCTDALIKAGVKRVVYGFQDPNPKVAGKGEAALVAAGIQCQHLPLPAIDDFYASYRHWQQTHKPFITAKIAMTLDGKIATKDSQPIQITGKELKEFTHRERKNSDAILTTIKTILYDDPELNARIQEDTIAKPLYILDSDLNFPPQAKVFKTATSLTIFHAKSASINRQQELSALGIRCVPLDESHPLTSEQVEKGKPTYLNLNQAIEAIGKDGVHDLWVEAGGICFSALVKQNLVQRALIYIAPWTLGEGLPAFPADFDLRLRRIHWQPYGNDVLCAINW